MSRTHPHDINRVHRLWPKAICVTRCGTIWNIAIYQLLLNSFSVAAFTNTGRSSIGSIQIRVEQQHGLIMSFGQVQSIPRTFLNRNGIRMKMTFGEMAIQSKTGSTSMENGRTVVKTMRPIGSRNKKHVAVLNLLCVSLQVLLCEQLIRLTLCSIQRVKAQLRTLQQHGSILNLIHQQEKVPCRPGVLDKIDSIGVFFPLVQRRPKVAIRIVNFMDSEEQIKKRGKKLVFLCDYRRPLPKSLAKSLSSCFFC